MAFKDARIRANLTQEAAAVKFGVDQSTIHAWETGKWLPRAAMLPKVAEVYHCTVDDLFKREKETTG